MKVECKRTFEPVFITLETSDEVDNLGIILSQYISRETVTEANAAKHNFAYDLRQSLAKALKGEL